MISTPQFFKCLSDDTRLFSTLLIYSEKELCVCELMEALALSQPKVSRHLAQLKACRILNDERRGQWVYYSLRTDLPDWALAILQISSDTNRETLSRLRSTLSRMKTCQEVL